MMKKGMEEKKILSFPACMFIEALHDLGGGGGIPIS